MQWVFEKFQGDGALYAFCPKCSFYYGAGVYDQITKLYNFCPMCGEFLSSCDEFDLIWNERDIMELYKE